MASVTGKILEQHIVEGEYETGEEIGIKIDQTLTQDATGTMAYLEFEAMGVPKVNTELSISYVDHNMLQTDFKNADDHDYLKSVAAKHGIRFSRAGNGICHQVHLERFARPGRTLLGSDSHTPTAGGVGSIAIGAGGLDVAVAMGGGIFYLKTPKVVGVRLRGRLAPWVSAKDVILELLRRLDVKGGVGKVFEYFGDGVSSLSVPERATITNMGTELGATTSIFPSDDVTRDYLESQERADQWVELKADSESDFDEIIEIDLTKLEPLVSKPFSPGNVSTVRELEGTKVNQVIVGSCTNSSFRDLMVVAKTLRGRKVHPNISFCVLPGSRQVYSMIARNGALADLIAAGARILESACGPCIGMGQAPRSGGVTVRTFNRNFKGRCGTKDADTYLCSPETAVAIVLNGEFTNPVNLGHPPDVEYGKPIIDDSMIVVPPKDGSSVEVVRGPNIKPLPDMTPMNDQISKEVLMKVGDNITTDHIMPAGAQILPLRSNIPAISEFVFSQVDKEFPKRAKEKGGGIIIGGENYGQGSSREHAAIAPLHLGVKAVIAKSWARIHKSNLVNFGIIPLTFADPSAYDRIEKGDILVLDSLQGGVESGQVTVTDQTKGFDFKCLVDLSKRSKNILLAGGKINYIKNENRIVEKEERGGYVMEDSGERVRTEEGRLIVPENPIIPYIEGDGVGVDISPIVRKVVDAAVEKAYDGRRKIHWKKLFAGAEAKEMKGEYLPQETIDTIKDYLVAIKGPLTTPVGGGIRSLNVTMRQVMDLYACVRPVRWFKGTPAPVKEPDKLDIVVFRENTEDVYAGIEWKEGTPEARKAIDFLKNEMGREIREDSGIGVKPISIEGTKRLVSSAIQYAIDNDRKSVTLVHKGNIMKFTEGAFMEWGYEVARERFADKTVTEAEVYEKYEGVVPDGKIMIKDRIADAMFQQILLRPDEYEVIATPNLNGDYISDAAAAQVGGLGMAPGANINYTTKVALFEATHGTAPKHAGANKVNPSSLLLSASMMLHYLGWGGASKLIEDGLERTIESKRVTYDLERQINGATLLSCSEFGNEIIGNM